MSNFDQTADQEAKKTLVLYEITQRCNADAEFDHLRAIGQALDKGDSLDCKIIAGGKTNYSYKAFCVKDPSLAVYAKISFAYALWNPDKSQEYDLQRAVNEFEIVQKFVHMMEPETAPVAQPYFFADLLDGTAKLIVTEWARTSEQWAVEFMEGSVNAQISEQLAKVLGKLNLQTIEPSFNENIRPCFRSLFGVMESRFEEMTLLPEEKKNDANDVAVPFIKAMGSDVYHTITQNMDHEFMNVRDVICHNDSHQFNVLISGLQDLFDAPDDVNDNEFVICDWEMAICGPVGRDAGLAMSFPIACVMCFAIQGRREEALEILHLTTHFWETYAHVLREGGKDDLYLRKAFLSALGVCGFYLFGVYYVLGAFAEFMPLEGVPHQNRTRAISAFAKVGLDMLWVSYGGKAEGMSYPSVLDYYKQLVSKHMELCLSVDVGGKTTPRRQSILRTAERRVSDAFLADEAVFRTSATGSGARRASIYDTESLDISQEFHES